MLKTFVFRIYPNKEQIQLLDATIETCRRWYNECLAERKFEYETNRKSISKFDQLAKVKDYKKSNPYAATIHSHILQVVTSDLDKSFQSFFRRVKHGETPGYPRFKGKDRFDSIGLKEYGNGFKIIDKRLRISAIGNIKVRWHRPIEGEIKTVRIKRTAGKWFASFACDVEPVLLEKTGLEVGVDVGIKSPANDKRRRDRRESKVVSRLSEALARVAAFDCTQEERRSQSPQGRSAATSASPAHR